MSTSTRTQRLVLGGAVRKLREAYGIAQGAFALSCDMSPGYLANIEAGRKQPSPVVLRKIVDRLGVGIDDITYVIPGDDDKAVA
jgi:transcriptional regulator with XRE-family HTH domain